MIEDAPVNCVPVLMPERARSTRLLSAWMSGPLSWPVSTPRPRMIPHDQPIRSGVGPSPSPKPSNEEGGAGCRR